jgi:hypothetical protein
MPLNLNDIEQIKSYGFLEFKAIAELFQDTTAIPKQKGVYLVLYLEQLEPDFLAIGTGGYFKGRNPNVSNLELQQNWVKKVIVIYIGKAGGSGGIANLHSRLKQYLSFGQGKNIGHWGGRLIWQIKSSSKLVVCWKPLPNDEPREVEASLIQRFVSQFGKRPFANLVD